MGWKITIDVHLNEFKTLEENNLIVMKGKSFMLGIEASIIRIFLKKIMQMKNFIHVNHSLM